MGPKIVNSIQSYCINNYSITDLNFAINFRTKIPTYKLDPLSHLRMFMVHSFFHIKTVRTIFLRPFSKIVKDNIAQLSHVAGD